MGPLNCDQLHLTAQLLVARWASEVSSADVAALSSASAWKPPLEARSPLQFALYECLQCSLLQMVDGQTGTHSEGGAPLWLMPLERGRSMVLIDTD